MLVVRRSFPLKLFGLGIAVHMKVGFTKILTTPDI